MDKIVALSSVTKVRKIGTIWSTVEEIQIEPFTVKVSKVVDTVKGVPYVGILDSLVVKLEGYSGWFLIREDFLISNDQEAIKSALDINNEIQMLNDKLQKLYHKQQWTPSVISQFKRGSDSAT